MKMIGLLLPALISLKLSLNRNTLNIRNNLQVILRYGIYVLIINWLAQMMITYILNIPDVTVDALNSFPFFTKYIVIAVIIAILLPFVQELIHKYFKITVETGVNVEKEDNDKENN